MVFCCQMDNTEKAVFNEPVLFCTPESSSSTVLYHKKLSDNEIFLL